MFLLYAQTAPFESTHAWDLLGGVRSHEEAQQLCAVYMHNTVVDMYSGKNSLSYTQLRIFASVSHPGTLEYEWLCR